MCVWLLKHMKDQSNSL